MVLDGTEILVGAAVGSLFGVVVDAVRKMKHRAATFRSRMEELEAILGYAKSVVEIKHYNNNSNTNELSVLMEEGERLLHKCSTFEQWEYIRRVRYHQTLLKLNKKLVACLIHYIRNLNQNQKYQTTLLALINLHNNMMVT